MQDKLYIHKPEPVLEKETNKIVRDFEIKTDKKIQVRRLDLVSLLEEKNLSSRGFCYSSGPQIKYKRKRKDRQILGLF